MKDQHPWCTRIGFLIFVVVPATSLYYSQPEPRAQSQPVALVAATKAEPPAPEPKKTGRQRMVISLNAASASSPESLYVAKEPPEEINWYAFAD